MNKRILILDDDPAILEVVTEALRYSQYVVLDIALGKLLFPAVSDFSPHLILLDYKLADTNGGDLCRQLKNLPESRHIPVIIFSAYFTPSDKPCRAAATIFYTNRLTWMLYFQRFHGTWTKFRESRMDNR